MALIRPFGGVAATVREVADGRAGDDIVSGADVVMDRGFTVAAAPEVVWPWLVQLGKGRAGWYLPRTVERFIPRSRRAIRVIDPKWQDLDVGDVIPDYGGRDATFHVAIRQAPTTLVYESRRGHMHISWAITLTPEPGPAPGPRTRVHLRLRLGPVKRRWLATSAGEFIDLVTVAGMAAGLAERVAPAPPSASRV